MTQMQAEVYDRVRVETLEVNDWIQVAGFVCRVDGVEDMGSHVILSWYNTDTDEEEEESLYAGTFVDLVQYTYKEDE
jgi:hypothetical protein